MRVSCSEISSPTAATGISETSAITSASNSSVKPEPGRAHATATRRTPCSGQRTRGTRATRVGLVLEEVEVAPASLGGVVDLAAGEIALRAGEAGAPLEVDAQVEAPPSGIEGGPPPAKARKAPGRPETARHPASRAPLIDDSERSTLRDCGAATHSKRRGTGES